MVPEAGSSLPVDLSYLRWFDHYLKGEDNAVTKEPLVVYYVMGPFDGSLSSGNVWRTADHWPVASTPTPLYLDGSSGLKGEKSALSDDKAISFRYDPADPSPTIGGRNLFLESGPKDQRAIEQREDVLVFTSQPLGEDLEVTGHVTAQLFLTSDCRETDLAVRLCDVYPDGRSILIADGLTVVQMLSQSGEAASGPVAVDLDLLATSMVFAKGHSIRVSVTSANYPCFEKSVNGARGAADKAPVATNTLHTGWYYPSRITLPVVKRTGEVSA